MSIDCIAARVDDICRNASPRCDVVEPLGDLRFRALLSDASGEIIQHISRDLERQERGLGPSVVPLSRGRSAAE